MKVITLSAPKIITSDHPDFCCFSTGKSQIIYQEKYLKRGPSFAHSRKKQAEEFAHTYCDNLFYLIVEVKSHLTIWFESKGKSNFPYSSNQNEQTISL